MFSKEVLFEIDILLFAGFDIIQKLFNGVLAELFYVFFVFLFFPPVVISQN